MLTKSRIAFIRYSYVPNLLSKFHPFFLREFALLFYLLINLPLRFAIFDVDSDKFACILRIKIARVRVASKHQFFSRIRAISNINI